MRLITIWAVSTRLVPLSMLHFCIYRWASDSVILFRSISSVFASVMISCSSLLRSLGLLLLLPVSYTHLTLPTNSRV